MEEVKMKSEFLILDSDYLDWVKELSARYHKSQIKAAVKVNQEMLRFYWELGKDIVNMKAESKWGNGFMKNLSRDLRRENPDATCFSPTNLLYMKNFYLLYQSYLENNANAQQVVEQIEKDIFSIPWGHHTLLIDKFKNQPQKALFFAHQTVENGWSRATLLNFLSSDLYERQGKALTNFKNTLPDVTSDLAQ